MLVKWQDYDHALEYLDLDNLAMRQDKLCLIFAEKRLKHETYFGSITRVKKNILSNLPVPADLETVLFPQLQRACNRDAAKKNK